MLLVYVSCVLNYEAPLHFVFSDHKGQQRGLDMVGSHVLDIKPFPDLTKLAA